MPLSEEHKAKMKAGRERAAAERKARGEKRVRKTPQKRLETVSRETELIGLTNEECPVGCTAERCVITGVNVCGHPRKGGLQPIFKASTEISKRYDNARKHLAHVELDRRP